MKSFGPALITHNGMNLGKTIKGGTYSLTSVRKRKAGPTPDYDSIVVGGNGTFHLFEMSSQIDIKDNVLFKDFGELIVTTPFITITFYKAKLFYNEKLDFGVNTLNAFDIDFIFVKNASGNLLSLT